MKPVHTGSDLLIQSLLENNVEIVFGYPGGAVLPIFDALYQQKPAFKNILCRHEQGLIHAAEGYARTTGKPGVVIATSGPGITNLLTGIADAMLDSLPIVVLTGQVAAGVIGTDAFQEADVIGLTTPISKHNFQLHSIEEIPSTVNKAFHIATTGRPGPVIIDIPKNIAETIIEEDYSGDFHLPGYQPNVKPNIRQIRRVLEALNQAQRPVLLAGAGVISSGASDHLYEFIDRYPMPVVNTLQGIGAFPGTHPLSLGMAGMHGTYAANEAITQSDLLINIGARFDDRLTGNLAGFAPNAKVVHIDIDPAEISKNVKADIAVVADADEALAALLAVEPIEVDFSDWIQINQDNAEEYPLWFNHHEELISPQWFIRQVSKKTNNEAIVVTDVGQHQMWSGQFYDQTKPNHFVSSGGLGTMGFGLPAAIGAQLGNPDETVVLFVGDGGIQMTIQELATIRQYNLPIKIFILNNETLGMVRQWQELLYEERYSQSMLNNGLNPDFLALAASYGIKSLQLTKEDQVEKALDEIFAKPEPVLVDVRIPTKEKVFPMVPAGKSNHEMLGVKPL
ncbi:biosynthetic-type acetolactate synthase large subunit [Hutsoniella sourekii]